MPGELSLITMPMLAYAVTLLPVFLFLLVLTLLDSYRLVRPSLLAIVFFMGCTATLAAYFLNTRIAQVLGWAPQACSRYIAPVVEESLKAAILLWLIRRKKTGFMIDAALYGFTAGAGFSFAENLLYLATVPEPNLAFITIRGFGTAIMHCGATALVGVLTLGALSIEKKLIQGFLPGLMLATGIHSAFNHFYLNPLLQTLMIIVLIPAILVLIFRINEKQLQKWLEIEFFSEAQLLAQMIKGKFSESKSGKYLARLKEHFPPETIVDMYCYFSLYLELSVKSKRNLMLAECGLPVMKEAGIDEKRKEFAQLRKTLGKSGELALSPLLKLKQRDLWKLERW